jgi:hypothetical protein
MLNETAEHEENDNQKREITKEGNLDSRRFTIQFDRKSEGEQIDKIESLIELSKRLKQSRKPSITDIFKLGLDRINEDDIEKLAEDLLTPKEKFESEIRKIMIEEVGNDNGDVYQYLMTSKKAKNQVKKLQ